MKNTKNIKKGLSLLLTALMLLSMLSIGVMAEDSVPTSDTYEIDSEAKVMYIAKNTYVGDFLKSKLRQQHKACIFC